MLNTKRGKLPDFVIAGVQKCGTTSLYEHLQQHPQIEMTPNFYDQVSQGKEVNFFTSEQEWQKGVDWYKKVFNNNGKKQGEANPYYTLRQHGPERMASVIPDAKLIIILRDPVRRFFSLVNHYAQLARYSPVAAQVWAPMEDDPRRLFERESRGEILADQNHLGNGCYAHHLQRLLKYYSRDRVLVLIAERFLKDPVQGFHSIFHFIGLPPYPVKFSKGVHKRQYIIPVEKEIEERLYGLYRPYNQQLFDLLGYEIPEWSSDRSVRNGVLAPTDEPQESLDREVMRAEARCIFELGGRDFSLDICRTEQEARNIQMPASHMHPIGRIIKSIPKCRCLIFGAGYDSSFWAGLNAGGRTVFLENDPHWIGRISEETPSLEIVRVDYTTRLIDCQRLLWAPRHLKMELPSDLTSEKWDVIIVDAPAGYSKRSPGRMQSIYTALQLAHPQAHIFVHDYHRPVEKLYCDVFFRAGDRQAIIPKVKQGKARQLVQYKLTGKAAMNRILFYLKCILVLMSVRGQFKRYYIR